MTEKIHDFSTESELLTDEVYILDAANNLRAMVEFGVDDPDQAVAELVEATGEAYVRGEATYQDAVIADEVGVQRALAAADAEDTLRALSDQSVEPLHDALGIAAHDEPETLDFVRHKLDEISKEHHTVYSDPIDHNTNPFIVDMMDDFKSSHDFWRDESFEIVEQSGYVLNEHDIARQNEAVDDLLVSADRQALLDFMNAEPVVDVNALRKVIDVVAEDAYKVMPWTDDDNEKVLWAIGHAIGEKLQYIDKDSFKETVESVIAKGGEDAVLNSALKDPVSNKVVGELLLEHGKFSILARNIDKFSAIDKAEFVVKLYEQGQADMVLSNLYNFPDIDKDELIEQIYQLDDSSGLAYHIDYLPIIDRDRLVNKLYEQGKAYVLPGVLDKFPAIDKTELMLQCIDQEAAYCLIGEPRLFEGADIAAVKEKLLQAGKFEVLMKERAVFSDVPIEDVVDGLIAQDYAYIVVDAIGKTPEVTADSVYQKLIDAGKSYGIVQALSKFPNADANALMLRAIDEGDAWIVCDALADNQDVDMRAIVGYMIATGNTGTLFYNREKLRELSDADIATMLIDNHKYADLISNMEELENIDTAYLEQHCIAALQESGSLLPERDFSALNEYISNTIPVARQPLELRLANRYMSFSGATMVGYRIVSDLHNEREIPLEAQRIGVTKTGVKGLEQFGVSCSRISRHLMDVSMPAAMLEEVKQSDLYQGILQKMYRVDSAEFGDTSDSGIKTLLDYYSQAQADGRIAPLEEHYQSVTVEIATLKSDKERVELTEDAYDRYAVLREDVTKAIGALETRQAFTHLTHALGGKISEEIMSTRQQLTLLARADQSNKAIEYKNKNLHAKEAALSTLIAAANDGKYLGKDFILRSPADMSSVFNQLEPFDNLHGEMRQLTFAWALRKNPHMIEQLKNLSDEPGVEDLGTMRSFVDQIVNNETFGNYFSDKKIATKFKKLTSVRALDEALIRHQSQATVESQQTLQIMPTRSFSMELSGHVADACWASKYDSMAEQFPNMTSIILKRGEDGSVNERLVGSAMLIETSDEKGNPVLLLRGVNPIENYINKVQVSDFYNAMTSYCKTIAERKGMRPAIVIDTMSGASGTNRPALHDYMAKMKEHMENVAVDEATTTFNGYDVTEKSYALL